MVNLAIGRQGNGGSGESQSPGYGDDFLGGAFGQERTDTAGFVYPRYWSCYTYSVKEVALHIKSLREHTFDWIIIHTQTPGGRLITVRPL